MGSNIISSLGAGSGIDVSGLVDSLVAVEKAPQTGRLDSRQEKLETQISAYGVLKSSLSAFNGVLAPLSNSDTFNARGVSFPDSDVITANKLDANAQTGTYQIEVLAVAQSQSLASAGVADPKAALAAGDITIRFGSWASYTEGAGPATFTQNADKESLTLTLDGSDSLEDLVKKINDAGVDLQASVIETDGQSQLLLTAPSGAKNAIEITADAALSQFSFKEGDHNLLQTQAAADASLKVNGLPVTRETNDIDDVIRGLSFTLNKQSADKITFSITEDKSTAEQAIRDYVEAYNTLYETMKNLTGTKKEDETEKETSTGGLATDGSAKGMISQIRQMMTAAVPGVDSNFASLANVGIKTELDGTLAITEDDFKGALKDNFNLVGSLFSRQGTSSNSNIAVGFGSFADKAIAGTYNVEITTEPEKGQLNGGSVDPVDFPLSTGVGGTYSFKVSVDGIKSNSIVLPDNKTYTSQSDVAVELQSLINGDDLLKAAGSAVDVTYNTTDNRFEFISRQYGASSSVQFSEAGSDMGTKLGITTALTGTSGKDVVGTIDGKVGFGSGNVLLPKVDSDPYGLNITVGAGSLGSSTITFSRGLAGELSLLIDNLQSSSGSIKAREDSINKQLTGIKSDRSELDSRMEKVKDRLLTKFLAMERIISSFKTTGNSLTGILDRLPFTAKKS